MKGRKGREGREGKREEKEGSGRNNKGRQGNGEKATWPKRFINNESKYAISWKLSNIDFIQHSKVERITELKYHFFSKPMK